MRMAGKHTLAPPGSVSLGGLNTSPRAHTHTDENLQAEWQCINHAGAWHCDL